MAGAGASLGRTRLRAVAEHLSRAARVSRAQAPALSHLWCFLPAPRRAEPVLLDASSVDVGPQRGVLALGELQVQVGTG